MNSNDLTNDLERTIKRLKEERCGKVLRKMFWLFTGGDTSRWFEGKPKNVPSTTHLKKKQELLSRHYSTEFVAGRVYRTCTVNFELSEDKRKKIDKTMRKLRDCGLVECVNGQKAEGQRCWKLTELGLACALSIKEEIREGKNVTWDVEEIKRKRNSLEKAGIP